MISFADTPVFAPLCLDALTARVAEQAGFTCGYVSGGALGYQHAVSEALLSVDELADVVRHVTARSSLRCASHCGCSIQRTRHGH